MLKFYTVSTRYIDYLSPHEPNLFYNAKTCQLHSRKYVGVVLEINNFSYLAPLSSFKPKHKKMKDTIDLIKIGNYAVLNLNNMFPVPQGSYAYLNFKKVSDNKYRDLLQAEYRIILHRQKIILKNALRVYKHKLNCGNSTGLAQRCNNFKRLENLCLEFK